MFSHSKFPGQSAVLKVGQRGTETKLDYGNVRCWCSNDAVSLGLGTHSSWDWVGQLQACSTRGWTSSSVKQRCATWGSDAVVHQPLQGHLCSARPFNKPCYHVSNPPAGVLEILFSQFWKHPFPDLCGTPALVLVHSQQQYSQTLVLPFPQFKHLPFQTIWLSSKLFTDKMSWLLNKTWSRTTFSWHCICSGKKMIGFFPIKKNCFSNSLPEWIKLENRGPTALPKQDRSGVMAEVFRGWLEWVCHKKGMLALLSVTTLLIWSPASPHIPDFYMILIYFLIK